MAMHHKIPRKGWFAASLALLTLVGCQRPQVAEPLTANLAGDDPTTQMEFWHTLSQRRLASNDEAFHALLLFYDGADANPDYEHRVLSMKSRGLLPKGFDRPANETVTRGTVAVSLAGGLCIRGGVMMHLFGPSERYATREMVYRGIFPPSSPYQLFSGDQMIDVIGRAEDHERRVNRTAPAAQVDAAQRKGGESTPARPDERATPQGEVPATEDATAG